MIADGLGGAAAATRMVAESAAASKLARAGHIGHLEFLSYCLVPLSVGMFPHVFQHWLTAKSARSFRLTVVAHPVFIMVVWLPCILIGLWATAKLPGSANPNAVLGMMAKTQVDSDVLLGLVAAGVLAAIMSSLDSQFMCLGTMFTTDVLDPLLGRDRLSDAQKILAARVFVLLVVGATYALSLWLGNSTQVFDLGVWCFSGFTGLFPLAVAAIYWRGATRAGAFACVIATVVAWSALFYRDILAPRPAGASDEALLFGLMPVAFILLASTVALVGVSLVTAKPDGATLRKFFP
jgi:SSS family solute:Na+ symporter